MRTHRLDPKIAALRAVPLLSSCASEELIRVAALADRVARPAGTVLAHEGGHGGECFVVTAGTVSVRRGDAAPIRLGPGEIVGELALLDGLPRSATVIADTDVELLVFDPQSFERLLTEVPVVARRILATLGSRLRTVQAAAP